MYRFFIDLIDENNNFIFTKEQEHHLINVLRLKPNDKIIVIYKKKKYQTKIIKIKPLILEQEMEITVDNELPVLVTMIMPLLKKQNNDWIVEKATELGVNKIVPVVLQHCVVKNSVNFATKIKRWKEICRHASQQSNRNVIPEVTNLVTNIENLQQYQGDLNLIALETEKNDNFKIVLKQKNITNITFIFGPEGGFSKIEEDFFSTNFIKINLGKRILRSETTPLVILANLIYNYEI